MIRFQLNFEIHVADMLDVMGDSDWSALALASEMQVERSRLSRLLQRLRRQGLVEYLRAWRVTPKGRRFRAAYADRPPSVWKRVQGPSAAAGAAA